VSAEGEWRLAINAYEASARFAQDAINKLTQLLEGGTTNEIRHQRMVVEATFEAQLDAVESVYHTWLVMNGVEPDKRHLWKRPQ
jgi:hypothetical protein